MKAQVVYEREDNYDMHVGPYGYEKVGVLIEDRVIWLATSGYGFYNKDYGKWESIAKRIAEALNGEVDHE